MHLSPLFPVYLGAIGAGSGFLIARYWRGHFALAAIAAGLAIFIGMVIVDASTMQLNLNERDGVIVFYAMIGALSILPALLGAILATYFKRRKRP
ncbi:MAG: hypothetical protein WA908_04415 [Pontixanthobacter sp.]